MMRPTKRKVAGPGQIAATFLTAQLNALGIESTHHNAPQQCDATAQAAMLRVLLARLDKLGLSHSTQDDLILIAGQAYDLRSAAAMVRQLGRASA